MSMSSPETWRWIWLVVAVAAAVGEIGIAGSFFLAPLAMGALAAAIAAFLGVGVVGEWVLFLLVSGATFAGFRPLARRLDARSPSAQVGAGRWVSRQGVVLREIPEGPGETGLIRLDREEWRAESLTGVRITAGSTVLVTRVDGTRLVVVPIEEAPELPSTEQGA
jgi:membrane protein implicated in regulation of membrane protease activity